MNIPNWENERSQLREKFTTNAIINAKRKELEQCLVILANSAGDTTNAQAKAETERFSMVVSQLLQVRINEELAKRASNLSLCAIIISVVAIVIAGFQLWHDLH